MLPNWPMVVLMKVGADWTGMAPNTAGWLVLKLEVIIISQEGGWMRGEEAGLASAPLHWVVCSLFTGWGRVSPPAVLSLPPARPLCISGGAGGAGVGGPRGGPHPSRGIFTLQGRRLGSQRGGGALPSVKPLRRGGAKSFAFVFPFNFRFVQLKWLFLCFFNNAGEQLESSTVDLGPEFLLKITRERERILEKCSEVSSSSDSSELSEKFPSRLRPA